MALSEKQKLFCDEYLICLNATQAALRAGYSKATARYASKWINDPQKPTSHTKVKFNPEMRAYIDKRLEELEDEKIAKQDEILKYLTSVMRREKMENVVVTIKEEKTSYVPDKSGISRRHTVKTEKAQIVEIPTQIKDSNKAAELLGRTYGIYKDRIDADVYLPVFAGEDDLEE